MRIVQVITKLQRRGAEIFAAQLSQELENRGHKVLLIALYPGDGFLPFEGEKIVLGSNPKARFFDWKGWSKFSRLLKEFNPDLIQLNASETLKFAVFSKLFFRWDYPLVYRNANQMGSFLNGTLKNRFNQLLVSRLKGVISVSEASAKDFALNFPNTNPVVIPIGIDEKQIEHSLKESPDNSLPKCYLIQIGGLVQEKDPIGMLEIFEQNAKNNPELHLVYVGSGPLEASLREAIKLRNLGQIVHVIPNQLNIFPILSRAKALVMPSKIEGLPAVILEAMYCKIPIVAYRVGGIGEIIQTDKTGWLVEKGDEAGFGKAINQVLEMPSAQLTLITDYGKKMVLEKYTLEKVAHQFEAFYKNLPAKARDQTNNF